MEREKIKSDTAETGCIKAERESARKARAEPDVIEPETCEEAYIEPEEGPGTHRINMMLIDDEFIKLKKISGSAPVTTVAKFILLQGMKAYK